MLAGSYLEVNTLLSNLLTLLQDRKLIWATTGRFWANTTANVGGSSVCQATDCCPISRTSTSYLNPFHGLTQAKPAPTGFKSNNRTPFDWPGRSSCAGRLKNIRSVGPCPCYFSSLTEIDICVIWTETCMPHLPFGIATWPFEVHPRSLTLTVPTLTHGG